MRAGQTVYYFQSDVLVTSIELGETHWNRRSMSIPLRQNKIILAVYQRVIDSSNSEIDEDQLRQITQLHIKSKNRFAQNVKDVE